MGVCSPYLALCREDALQRDYPLARGFQRASIYREDRQSVTADAARLAALARGLSTDAPLDECALLRDHGRRPAKAAAPVCGVQAVAHRHDPQQSCGANLAVLRSRLLDQGILPAHFAEGMVEHRNVVLQAEPDVCILGEGAFARHFNDRRLQSADSFCADPCRFFAQVLHLPPLCRTRTGNSKTSSLI